MVSSCKSQKTPEFFISEGDLSREQPGEIKTLCGWRSSHSRELNFCKPWKLTHDGYLAVQLPINLRGPIATNLRGAHQREDQLGAPCPKPEEGSVLAKLSRKRGRPLVLPPPFWNSFSSIASYEIQQMILPSINVSETIYHSPHVIVSLGQVTQSYPSEYSRWFSLFFLVCLQIDGKVFGGSGIFFASKLSTAKMETMFLLGR